MLSTERRMIRKETDLHTCTDDCTTAGMLASLVAPVSVSCFLPGAEVTVSL
jgi:hypothetical protein